MAATDTAQSGWPARYRVVLLAALAVFICYMDRVVISVAIIPMVRRTGRRTRRKLNCAARTQRRAVRGRGVPGCATS